MAGGGVALIGLTLIPLLSGLLFRLMSCQQTPREAPGTRASRKGGDPR